MWIHAAKILQRMHRNTQESSYNMSTLADRTGRSAYENLSGLPLFLVARDWQNFLHSRIKKNDKKHKFLLSPSTDNRKIHAVTIKTRPRSSFGHSLFHVFSMSWMTWTHFSAPLLPTLWPAAAFGIFRFFFFPEGRDKNRHTQEMPIMNHT